MTDSAFDADVVVIGGGVAGCVAAHRLTRQGRSVIVVERGSPDAHEPAPPLDIDAAIVGRTIPGVMARRTVEQDLTTYVAGCGLGGGSLVNGALFDDLSGAAVPPVAHRSVGSGFHTLAIDGRRSTFAALAGEARVVHARVTAIRTARDAVSVELGDGSAIQAVQGVIAAGALTTPALLRDSGFDHEQLGSGLRDHAGLVLRVESRPRPTIQRIGGAAMVTSHGGRIAVVLLDTRSVGQMTPTHAELRLLDSHDDRDRFQTVLRQVLAAEPTAEGPDGTSGHALLAMDNRQLDEWILRNEGGVYHACGTAAADRVLDGNGRVPGQPALWVADAAALPELPRTLPMSTVVRWAEGVADAVAAAGRSGPSLS